MKLPVRDLLLWRILHMKLPVREVTSRWSDGNPWCPLCQCKKETLMHALWECKLVYAIWVKVIQLLSERGVED